MIKYLFKTKAPITGAALADSSHALRQSNRAGQSPVHLPAANFSKFIALLVLLLSAHLAVQAQVGLNLGTANSSVACGAQITVSVDVAGFTDIASLQFSVAYDETKLSLVSVTPVALDGSEGEAGTTIPGKISFAWPGATPPNNFPSTVADQAIVNFVFTALDDLGPTDLTFSSTPTPSEATDGNFDLVTVNEGSGLTLNFQELPVTCPNNFSVCLDAAPVALNTLTGLLPAAASGSVFSGTGVAVVNAGTGAYNFVPSTAGVNTHTITYTYTSGSGCTGDCTFNITVNPLPMPAITVADASGTTSNDGIICSGSSAILTASGGTSYAWSNMVATQAITVSAAGTYIVTVTDANGCMASTNTAVTVNPLPTPSISVTDVSGTTNNDGIICSGSSATLTANGGTSYAWSNMAATQAITVSASGTYIVTVTNANGCSASTNTAVTVNPLPTPSISVTDVSGTTNNDGIICSGSSATLTANGGTSYAWSNMAATQAITVSASGTYIVTVTNANGCTASTNTAVTVNPLPTPSISVTDVSGTTNNDGIICSGSSATLTANGGTSYAWSNMAATQAITVSASGTYIVTVTNANGCTASTNTAVTVNPLPTPSISVTDASGTTNNDGIICSGSSATLTANGGTSYAWSNMAATQAITVSASGTYIVTVTNANGCTASTNTAVTVNPLPTPSISVTDVSGTTNNDGIICSGSSATLTANGGTSYAWSNMAATQAITVSASGTYIVTVTNANGCTASTNTAVTVNPLPTPSISVTDVSGTTNNDGIICSGSSATLTANGGTSYAWSNMAATQAITVSASGTYIVTVTNANGCSASTNTAVTVNPLPTAIAVTGGGTRCSTDGGLSVGLSTSQSGVNYQLQIGGVNVGAPVTGTGVAIAFSPQSAGGTYTVVATNPATGCTNAMTGSVSINIVNCTSSISDPCACLNNATTLTDGQFGETVEVNGPAGQTWTVTAVSGLYSTSSPAPPAPPVAIAVGATMTEVSPGVYRLEGRHVDAVGYSISVGNGRGTTLSIGNTCEYPNPAITSNLDGPFCLYSTPVALTGTPGDANITTAGFTVNGTATTVFNPGSGVGAYTIAYTVDGGNPKAAGANDPGCVQTVTRVVQVMSTPSAVICNDMVQVSVDNLCSVVITPDMILEGAYGCYDDYQVTITNQTGSVTYANPLNGIPFGQTLKATVRHLVSGNTCWGQLVLEDKLPPVITNCPAGITVSCAYTADQLQNPTFTQGLGLALPTVSDCSAYTPDMAHGWQDIACNGTPAGVSAILTRTWTYTDAYGNISLPCVQTITLQRAVLADVVFPVDVTVQCNAAAANASSTEPSFTGVPTVPAIAPAGGRLNIYPNSNYCEMQATYADQVIDVCPGTYKILRTWTVYDWCTANTPGVNPLTYLQLIKVVDEHGPDVVTTYPAYPVPANMTVSTGSNDCTGTVNLPAFIISDNCSAVQTAQATISGGGIAEHGVSATISSNFVGSNAWSSERLVDFGNTNALPLGTYSVTYTFTDACGNATHVGPFTITVEDQTPPVAVCDEWTQVALGTNGQVVVYAGTFDDGSYDNCAPVQLRVRRMDAGCNISNANFTPSVTFCCDDVNDTLQVILRVYDVLAPLANSVAQDAHEGHYNDCMVNVLVEDKLKPTCTPPANATVSCDNFDATLWPYGTVTATDNCGVDTVTVTTTGTLNTCNIGTLTRRWTVRDDAGLTSTCQQTITVTPNQYYFVRFPEDKVLNNCTIGGDYGAPEFYGEDCELLATSFVDEVFTVVPDACYKIERTWTVINWCSYNSNTPCTIIPNPDGETHGKVVVSAPGNGIAGWAPSSMTVTAGSYTGTFNYGVANGGGNHAGFGGWSANANCYKYKQIIKIIDNTAPTVVSSTVADTCDYTTNDAALWHNMLWWDNTIESHDLCEGAVNLSLTATDACAGENVKVRYQLYLDLNHDGVMETVVPGSAQAPTLYGAVRYNNYQNPNFGGGEIRPFTAAPLVANNFGFGLQTQVSGDNLVASVRFVNTANTVQNTAVQLPYGTHKIKWIIEDGCGNEKVQETTFTVDDCKKPTVVCLNGVSVNLMNGPMNTVALWASDVYEYADDNCTPDDLIKITVVRADADNGSLPTGTSIDFSCADLLPGLTFGTVVVNVYAEDAAGNFDFCAMYVQVQDNMGVCEGTGINPSVAGALQTEVTEGVQDAEVELDGSANGIPMLETTFSTLNGEYLFNNTMPIAANATITPTLDVDPLNGVNTWDLVLISRHILGLEPLSTPYKLISADANKSGTVTTFDIVELRKLILGTYQVLPNNTSWRFINAHQEFTSDENPFADVIQENIQIANIQGSILDGNFVGAKIGDVDGSAIPNQLVSADDRTAGTLLFDVNDRMVNAGEEFTVQFKAAEKVAGYQFTIALNGLETMDIVPGTNMSMDNFGIFGNEITTSADGTDGVFAVTFRAVKGGQLSQMLNVSSRITKAVAFNGENKMDVAFRFNNGGASTIAGVGFELYQNAPNPFVSKTVVGFHLPESTRATLSVYDETGRILYTTTGNFAKGYNAVQLDRGTLNANGALYYKVETATDSAVKQMIQTR